MVFAKTARSLVEIGWGNRVEEAKRLHGIDEICFQWQSTGARVDVLRNQVVRDARTIEASHILFLDADMTFPHDLLPRILAHASDPWRIVGGLYVLKGPPYAPVALINERHEQGVWWFDYLDLDGVDDLARVDVIGMGCTLIPMEAFECEEPWFAYRDDSEGEPRVSEDVEFCQRARERGFEIFVDTRIQADHLTVEPRGPAWSAEYQRAKAARLPLVASRV